MWWPQFRTHHKHMAKLRKYVGRIAPGTKHSHSFFEHTLLGDLRESMDDADAFYGRSLLPGDERIERRPALDAVLKRAGVDVNAIAVGLLADVPK